MGNAYTVQPFFLVVTHVLALICAITVQQDIIKLSISLKMPMELVVHVWFRIVLLVLQVVFVSFAIKLPIIF